jgi:glycine cleavage system aminomethyltransferase T
VEAWLGQALSGHCAIDLAVPSRALPNRVRIQRVDNIAGPNSLVVLGLAGPNAATVLRALADGAEDRRAIGRLRRFTLASVRLAGQVCTVARTGHTGPTQSYEIFTRRDAKSALWSAALAKGAESGIKPIGWDAWHASGISAGLAWDGHEIDGPKKISPLEAGYGAEVRVHKPFFVGRRPLLATPYPTENLVTRYRIVDGEPPTVRAGSPVAGADGVIVGWVTSPPNAVSEPIGMLYGAKSSLASGARLSVLVGSAPWVDRTATGPLDQKPLVTIEVLARYPK